MGIGTSTSRVPRFDVFFKFSLAQPEPATNTAKAHLITASAPVKIIGFCIPPFRMPENQYQLHWRTQPSYQRSDFVGASRYNWNQQKFFTQPGIEAQMSKMDVLFSV